MSLELRSTPLRDALILAIEKTRVKGLKIKSIVEYKDWYTVVLSMRDPVNPKRFPVKFTFRITKQASAWTDEIPKYLGLLASRLDNQE